MIDSLKKIKEAEKRATERIEAAKKESEARLRKAEQDTKDILDKAVAGARKNAAGMMEKACSEAQTQAEQIVREGTQSSKAIRDEAERHIDAAAKVIVSRIVGEV